jgi:high affinity sulfate transporter 1
MNNGIFKWMPGLLLFKGYQPKWFSNDFIAGLSVASVALPVGIAYTSLAGLPPEVGLYSSILPLIGYVIFGSSRQLIVGPDSAICMMIAASLAVFGPVSPEKYASLSILLSLLVGVFCVAAGLFRLGFIANFLSKPILNGFFNGIAISVITGQLGKFFGFKLISGGFFRQFGDFISRLNETHFPTLIIGLSSFLLLIILKRFAPKIPGPLIAVVGAIGAVFFMHIDKTGTLLVGAVPAGFPGLNIPAFSFDEINLLAGAALSIMLISYCNTMLANKGFAVKNGYEIDANKDFIALGMSTLFSGFSQGYAVSGSVSRTSVSDNAGGKTKLTAIFASLTLLMVLFFFTSPLSYLPMATLAAILISAMVGLFNFEYLRRLYKVNKREFAGAAFTSLCVITIGILPGVLIAIGLALLRLLIRAANPGDEILGKIEHTDAYQDITEYENAQTIPGLLIYRYEAPLLFFNADNMRNRIRALISKSSEKINMVLIDASTFLTTDITGVEALGDLFEELKKQNIAISIARAKKEFSTVMDRAGISDKIGKENFFPSIRMGAENYMNKINISL